MWNEAGQATLRGSGLLSCKEATSPGSQVFDIVSTSYSSIYMMQHVARINGYPKDNV